jgi:hypothetical protein
LRIQQFLRGEGFDEEEAARIVATAIARRLDSAKIVRVIDEPEELRLH